jgi:hypothetical protein
VVAEDAPPPEPASDLAELIAALAHELADEVEGWIDERELDRELGASALDVLRRLGRRN